jgi:hypothetical protein
MEGESISGGKLHIVESYTVKPVVNTESMKKIVTEAKAGNKKSVLKPRIEAIHAGRTRNNNIYPAEKLRGDRMFKDANGNVMPSGVHSFTMPYPKPMVIDHYPTADNCTGRITNAQFIKDAAGREMIVIIPEVTSEDAIEKVLDGRYLTVSVGATTDSAYCNICGKDIINEGWCEHEKGQVYDGSVCGWIVGNLWFDECSWVAVPADTGAMVMDTGEVATMEAYMEVGNEFYDLSKQNGTSTITESAANTLGLVGSKDQPKGGLTQMPNEEKVPGTEEEVKDQPVEEHIEDPVPAEPEGTPTEGAQVPAGSEEPTAEEQLAAKDTVIAEKDNEISTLVTEKTSLEEKVATLESRVSELETEKQTLIDQQTEANASAHQDLVERVVDLKIGLGKPGVENREEAVAEHMGRSEQSLKDSYIDLMAEFKVGGKRQFIPEKVENPGAVGAVSGEPNTQIEGTVTKPSAPAVKDANEILKNLLTGSYRRQ